jgi:predicted RNase H-like HicB family nuclease
MQVDYTVQIWKEDSQFIAHAMPIDVVSSGGTIPDARIALDEAVQLFLETTREMGTLQGVLEECGYEIHDGSWRAPEWIAVERHSALLSA